MNLLRSLLLAALLAIASQASANTVQIEDSIQVGHVSLDDNNKIEIDLRDDGKSHNKTSDREHEVELRDDHLNAVPLPAAAWLFGSALIGFVAIAKRGI